MTQGELFDRSPRKVPKADMKGLIARSKVLCSRCGRNDPLQISGMDKSKCQALMDMAILHRGGNEWIRVEKGRRLKGMATRDKLITTYCADKHVWVLRLFGLTEQFKYRVANWKLTRKAYLFLHGEIMVPKAILSTKSQVFYESTEEVFISQVRGLVRDKAYWDDYPWSDFV